MISLIELWTFETEKKGSLPKPVRSLSFSKNGYLGIASEDYCAYIVDRHGNLVSKKCGRFYMNDVSFYPNMFGFMSWDAHAYIYDFSSMAWMDVKVGGFYNHAIAMLKDGFLAGSTNLAYFDFNGNKRWDTDIKGVIDNGLAVHGEYVYVAVRDRPSWFKGTVAVLRLSDGSEIRAIEFDEWAQNVQVCRDYLAVGTEHHVYLYDISDPVNPSELWSFDKIASNCNEETCYGARSVAFSPDCKYLVSVNNENHKIHLFSVRAGKQMLEREFDGEVYSVAWWMDRIAVGTEKEKVYVFKVKRYIRSDTGSDKERLTVRKLLFKEKDDAGQVFVD